MDFYLQIPKFERDTQTVLTKNRPQQVTVDAATQMVCGYALIYTL